MSYNLTVINEEVIFELSIQDGAAATALEAAARAELAETQAETAAANSETAAANSETAKTQAETAAANSETAKTQAETAAANSETAAANALASQNSATTSASEALASKNEIVSKIAFTGAVTGDLLERNAVGVYVPKSLQAINQNKTPFLKSGIVDCNINKLLFWDNFIRPNSSSLGVSDSGHPYQNLQGAGWLIESNEAKGQTSSISALSLADKFKVTTAYICQILFRNSPPTFGTRSGVAYFIDINNFIALSTTRNELVITKRTNGVDTTVVSISYAFSGVFAGISYVNSQLDFKFRIYSNSARTIIFLSSELLNISNSYDISDVSYYQNINHFGFINFGTSLSGNIINFKLIQDI